MIRRLSFVSLLLCISLSFGCAPKLKGPVFSLASDNKSGSYGYVSEVKGESIFLEGERVYGISVSADGHYLLLNRLNGDVIIDPKSNWIFEVADGAVFSPDSESVAIPDDDGVKIFNVQKHDLVQAWGSTGKPERIAFSPDGKLLAVATDEFVRVSNIDDGKIVFEKEVKDAYFSFSSDSQKLLVRLRNNISGTPIAPEIITGTIVFSVWLADATVGVFDDDELFLYDLENQQMLMEQVAVDEVIKTAKLSPDGRLLAVARLNDWESSAKSVLEIYNIVSGKKVHSWNTSQALKGITFSPNSEDITVYESGVVSYDLKTGEQRSKLCPNIGVRIANIEYSSNGRFMAIAASGLGAGQGAAVLYDVAEQRVLYARVIDADVNDVAFLPDGTAFVVASDKGVRLIPMIEFIEKKTASVK